MRTLFADILWELFLPALAFATVLAVVFNLLPQSPDHPAFVAGCFRLDDTGSLWLPCKQVWSNPLDWWEAGQDI